MMAQSGTGRNCFAVVANKSWYEGYIPFYIYFARRACPDAHVLVYLMGDLEPETRAAITLLGSDPAGYTVIENYKPDYGQSPIAAKMARFTIDDDLIRAFDNAYIGDLDMLICPEPESLFSQHLRNAESMGIPISNVVRLDTDRLTGLHFFRTEPYFAALAEAIARLDGEISQLNLSDRITEVWTTGGEDEMKLYEAIASVRPGWIAAMAGKSFRPHHGTHMGHFRNTKARSYRIIAHRISLKGANRYHRYTAAALPEVLRHPEVVALLTRFPKLRDTFDNFVRIVSNESCEPLRGNIVER